MIRGAVPGTRHPFWRHVEIGEPGACWPWRGNLDRDGYGIDGRGRAHRTAWALANGQEPGDTVVRHTCDRPSCCNPAHLIAGTQLQNVDDRQQRLRMARGTINGRNVLAEFDVWALYQEAGSYAQIAERYGVSKWTVADIKTGKTWSWLTSHIPSDGTSAGI